MVLGRIFGLLLGLFIAGAFVAILIGIKVI